MRPMLAPLIRTPLIEHTLQNSRPLLSFMGFLEKWPNFEYYKIYVRFYKKIFNKMTVYIYIYILGIDIVIFVVGIRYTKDK